MYIPVNEETERDIKEQIDNWSYKAFFAGSALNAERLFEIVAGNNSFCRAGSLKMIICNSPLECQVRANELAASGVDMDEASPVEHLWSQAETRFLETAWSEDWCETLPLFKTAKEFEKLGYISRSIISQIRAAASSSNMRYFRFSEDNLFSRHEKVAFYSFMRGYKFVISREFELYRDFLITGCFLSIFARGIMIVSRRPNAIHFNQDSLLHKDGGPAIEWKNGSGYFYLNGVTVPEEVAVTPAVELHPGLILTEKNVEVRREIVRKIGIERVLQKLGGRLIDSWNGYELLSLDIPDMRIKPTYLKMQNPSVGTYHVEGVPPHVSSCRQALSWRVGNLKWKPGQLT